MKNSHLIAGADFISGQQGRLGTSAWSSNSWGHGEYCNFTFGKSIKNSRFTNTQEMRLFFQNRKSRIQIFLNLKSFEFDLPDFFQNYYFGIFDFQQIRIW